MNKSQRIKLLRKEAAETLGGRCYVCNRPFGKGFSFHHIWYKETDKKYSDFKNNDSYNQYVLPIVNSEPERFALLCIRHHKMVEILKALKEDKFFRLINLVNHSRGTGEFEW